MGTLGRAAPWHSLFRFCCWLPPVLLAPHTGHTMRSVDLSLTLTLTSRHYLVQDLGQLSIIFGHSLMNLWCLEGSFPTKSKTGMRYLNHFLSNRFKLKHHKHDGFDEVLDAYGKKPEIARCSLLNHLPFFI